MYLFKVCSFTNYGAFEKSRIRNIRLFGVMLFLCCDNLFDWNTLYENIELVKRTCNELIVFTVVFTILTIVAVTFDCIDTNIMVLNH
ncbi:hypothetical protein ECANGB1_1640 [Enterospora canceri]|uniref:Uncharacterized protein n=1 Tax=Enterospora canceri TaxID=1081671 RepID=A0A1Y1S934_9MICR|nr:hypothetical protein ECANGB1_1640 [Enterospora canceri]